jgi:hypothetical protein
LADIFENSIHLKPEMTWEECATYIYDGVMDGKLNREDFIKFFLISGQEMSEPRHVRIFAKVIGAFFVRDYPELKSNEKPGIFVKVDGRGFVVTHNGKEIIIKEADYLKDMSDCSFLIEHETEADAKIAAWEKKEEYKSTT